MDAVLLARLQFTLTIAFHYIFPPITIGLGWLIFWFERRYLKTNDLIYKQLSDFVIKLFSITFAMGVATGITMEFQFGTNWADYSRFVGDIFGAPLAAEAIFAFFLESTFLGVLLYGKQRVSAKFYCFSSLMVAVGSTLSALWIIVANSWMQTPAGFAVIDGKAQLIDFGAALFNPSLLPRYLHTVNSALIVGSFFLMGIAARYLLRREHLDFAKHALVVSLVLGFASSVMVLPIGHMHAVQVAKTQPAKLAAFEGLWETQDKAPLLLFGLPDQAAERTKYRVSLPSALSILVGGSPDTVVRGLKEFLPEHRPPLLLSFFSFHAMVVLGGYFILLTSFGMYLWRKNKLFENRLFLTFAFYSLPLPIVAGEIGWMAAEVGRQPWIVYNILKTKDAISPAVSAGQILISIILFSAVYLFLFVIWFYLLRRIIIRGPKE